MKSLKTIWYDSTRNINATEINMKRKQTSLEKLASRYKSFSSMSAVMVMIIGAIIVLMSISLLMPIPIWLIICLEIYFATAACMDYWLFKGVKSLDCCTMNVDELLRKTMLYRKRHLQFMAILLPMALGLITAMAIHFQADKAIIIGMITGFIIGAAWGVKSFIDFMRDYREIIS